MMSVLWIFQNVCSFKFSMLLLFFSPSEVSVLTDIELTLSEIYSCVLISTFINKDTHVSHRWDTLCKIAATESHSDCSYHNNLKSLFYLEFSYTNITCPPYFCNNNIVIVTKVSSTSTDITSIQSIELPVITSIGKEGDHHWNLLFFP